MATNQNFNIYDSPPQDTIKTNRLRDNSSAQYPHSRTNSYVSSDTFSRDGENYIQPNYNNNNQGTDTHNIQNQVITTQQTHNQNPPIPNNNNMTENNSNSTNIFKSCPGNSSNPFFGLPGALRVAQFLFGLISWSIVVSIPYWNYGGYNSSLVYGAAIQIIFWIFDFFLIIIFSLKLQERINITAYNLALSELILNSLASFLIFVGAICIATYGGGKVGWAAGFAFLNCFCWGGSALLAFWRWQNNGGSIKCGNGSS